MDNLRGKAALVTEVRGENGASAGFLLPGLHGKVLTSSLATV